MTNHYDQMLSPCRFTIRLMIKEDRNEVLSLLLNSFFREEPLAQCLQLDQQPTIEFANQILDDAFNDQCSFIVYDHPTKQIIGICLNEIQWKDHQHVIKQTNEKIKYILLFLNSMHLNQNLFNEFQTDLLLHIFILNIHQTFRGYELGSQLISTTIEYAQQRNIQGIYAETTNIYSLKSFQKQSFLIYNQMKYIHYDHIRLANLIQLHQNQCQLVARALTKHSSSSSSSSTNNVTSI